MTDQTQYKICDICLNGNKTVPVGSIDQLKVRVTDKSKGIGVRVYDGTTGGRGWTELKFICLACLETIRDLSRDVPREEIVGVDAYIFNRQLSDAEVRALYERDVESPDYPHDHVKETDDG